MSAPGATTRLTAAIDMLEPESEPRRRNQLLYDLKIREAEGTERLMKENLDREVMVRELTIYEEIEEAARKVAEAKGASIVIRLSRRETGDAKTMNAASLRQRHAAARGRDVLYAADQLDLTDDVIKRLLVPPEKPGAGK
jgi:Skp family chaperone for outer membrane proteins